MKTHYLYLFLLLISLSFSCRTDEDVSDETEVVEDEDADVVVDTEEYPDWTEATHGDDADLDYSVVFAQDTVLRFDIVIDSDDWSDMRSDLSSNYSNITSSDYTPVWVPCSFTFDSTEWYHVGIRYKGNSSLQTAYAAGNGKLSFKLDFDEFEDDYPSLKNQRFYGFKQLNLNNNYDDESLMREKVAADLFRDFGVPASQTTFCVIYIDHGNGPQYFGVYTLVEEVDDTVIETQFDDGGSGNLYKPDGDAASFANGTYDTDELEKKTNEDENDYSDVKSLYTIINSSDRTNDTEQWKSDLEGVFDVDHFLKWLAANTVIQNWDTYGNMTHNYFLYNDSTTNQLTWIPWDNNEAFQSGKQSSALSFSMNEVSSSWPLIKYLINIDEYEEIYEGYLYQFVNEVFASSEMSTTYSSYYNLLKDYAYAEESGYTYLESDSDFDSAVSTLKSHAKTRNSAVTSYLN
ncbi:CotH kinase family protein [Labilibaculum sp.]|uniref:CotH kinase family protein n=1 Tax=Labilibaculum sp. TaxID=2060723 RepID=UPI003565D9E0